MILGSISIPTLFFAVNGFLSAPVLGISRPRFPLKLAQVPLELIRWWRGFKERDDPRSSSSTDWATKLGGISPAIFIFGEFPMVIELMRFHQLRWPMWISPTFFFYTWPEPSNMCLNCRIVECNEDFNYTIRGYNLILLIYLDDRMWRVG